MDFEWDEGKSDACFQERGFDFAYAAHAFFDPGRWVRADTRHSYGEDRFQHPRASSLHAKPTNVRYRTMKTTRIRIDPTAPAKLGRIDAARVDATTDADITRHAAADAQQAAQDAGQFARQVRKRMGLSQAAFAQRIEVPLETIRNWEQGKRSPTGAAKALLRLLDKAPELALQALH